MFELTNPEVAILMMSIFLFIVLLGFPIAFTLMAMGIVFGYYAYYDPALMENIFDTAVLVVTLTAVAASITLFGVLLSGKMIAADIKPFDKAKMKYTDGDNT